MRASRNARASMSTVTRFWFVQIEPRNSGEFRYDANPHDVQRTRRGLLAC